MFCGHPGIEDQEAVRCKTPEFRREVGNTGFYSEEVCRGEVVEIMEGYNHTSAVVRTK